MLKLLVTPVAELGPREQQRMQQELATLSRLQHPSIVQVCSMPSFYYSKIFLFILSWFISFPLCLPFIVSLLWSLSLALCGCRALAGVQHMGACIYQGQLGLILEFLEGGSLQQAIWHHAMAWGAAAAQVLVAVARGLDYLHGQGFVHGDLKSRNVLLARCVAAMFGAQVVNEQTNKQRNKTY